MRHRFPELFVLALCLLGCGALNAATPEEVFQKASPGIVRIADIEGHGSGVVLTAEGLILTCYHVIAFPLDHTVTARVTEGGREVTKTFKKIEIVGVHPRQDLVLLKVADAGGARFHPVERVVRPLRAGEACYAVGSADGGGNEPLTNTIAAGVISATNRVVDGQNVIQTSAPVNTDTTGGALCDADGKLIGIITFKAEGTDEIGFAIATAGFKESSFKPLKERRGNRVKGMRYRQEGAKWLAQYRSASGKEKDAALFLAFVYLRMSLAEMPNDAASYNNLGVVYFELREFKLAKAFYEKALEIDPDTGNAYKVLGVLAQKDGDTEKAKQYWYRGMLNNKDKLGASECAENYAVSMHQEKQYAAAAYCVKWANALHEVPRRARERRAILTVAIEHLTDKQHAFLHDKSKVTDFSEQGLKDFVANRLPAPTGPRPVDPNLPELTPALLEKIMAGAPDPGPGGLTKKFPDELVNAVPACGGAYIILQFKEVLKLGIFNVAHARFDKYIDVEKDCEIAAGGAGLLIYRPDKREFDTWRLDKMEKVATGKPRVPGCVLYTVMASDNAASALISYNDNLDPKRGERFYALMDTSDFSLRRFGGYDLFRHLNDPHYMVHARPDGRLTCFTIFSNIIHTPYAFIYARIPEGTGPAQVTAEHQSHRFIIPSQDGTRVYSREGLVVSAEGKILKTYPDASLFPVIGSNDFVEAPCRSYKASLNIHDGASFGTLATIDTGRQMVDAPPTGRRMTLDRCLVASAHTKRIALIYLREKTIRVFAMDIGKEAVASTNAATPGKPWQRKFDFPAGTKVKVEMAPEGMTFDTATMTLSWAVPAGQKKGDLLVLLNVVRPDGKESYERVSILVN